VTITTPAAALTIIKRWEGLRLKPYLCPAGYWTVGYGHVLRDINGRMLTAQSPRPTSTWTTAQAEHHLARDAQTYTAAAARLCPPSATKPNQLAALTSFAYNLGAGNLRSSTLRRCILDGDDDEAARQFSRWVFAGDRKLPGLVARRADEAALFATPDAPALAHPRHAAEVAASR